ncbi:MAG: hypothetical protein K0S65_1980 [Labilithrix sp.]|nr:hypothetical protein [Labilithrix sp.]
MRQARWSLLGAGLLFGLVGRGVTGCASSDESAPDSEVDSGGRDSMTSDGTTDPDGANPNDADADAKGPPCSADGWCRTALPTGPLIEAGVLDPDMPSLDLRDVWVAPDRTAWAVTITGHVLRWDGVAWQIAFDAGGPLHSVWGSGTTDLWMGGENGLVVHGANKGSGMTFERVAFAPSAVVVRVWGTSPSDVWAMTPDSVYRYTGGTVDGGPDFSEVVLPDPILGRLRILTDVWGERGELWLGGMENFDCLPGQCGNFRSTIVLFRWRGDGTGGGADWDRVEVEHPKLDPMVNSVLLAGGATRDGTQLAHVMQRKFLGLVRVAPGDAGLLDASAAVDAGGDYLRTMEQAISYGRPEGVWATTSNDVWMVGSPGLVRHWDGATWAIVRVAIDEKLLTKELHAISGTTTSSGARDMWIVGRDIAMRRSEAP